MAETLDLIEGMLQQEAMSYRTVDYLAPSFQQSLWYKGLEEGCGVPCPVMECGSGVGGSSSVSSECSSSSGITEMWREKICEWCYQVIDHFDFSREVVAIAMNYLDRYLACKVVNKKVFQLAAMTALFLAVKLHEPSKLSMASMIELSRGCFTVPQMVAMEISMIRSLGWHLHPPSAHSFAKRFLHLVSTTNIGGVDVLYDVLELSRFLAELAVIDYFFVMQRPSHIAVAAIANAMQDIPAVSLRAQREFFALLQRHFNIDIRSSHSISECRSRLRLLCALQGSLTGGTQAGTQTQTNDPSSIENPHLPGESSPVCVSYGTPIYHTQAASIKSSNNTNNTDPPYSTPPSSTRQQHHHHHQEHVQNPLCRPVSNPL